MKFKHSRYILVSALFIALTALQSEAQPLWDLAKENRGLLKISTLFTAQNVRDHLSGEQGISDAISWCKKTGVTHVFIEAYRDSYTAEQKVLENAKAKFEAEGFEVSGCVTTTKIGKTSNGWNGISCYTNKETQNQLQEIFEYTASLFDEIMIDDFLFTDCECDECKQARGNKSWADYRCDLMVRVSRDRILAPARKINPNVKIIIKYPQWYDDFHNRGYEVLRETADYDRIWVGTETRDFDNQRWGGKVQYEAYYIMRWLGEIGGAKTGGGRRARRTLRSCAQRSPACSSWPNSYGARPSKALPRRSRRTATLSMSSMYSISSGCWDCPLYPRRKLTPTPKRHFSRSTL